LELVPFLDFAAMDPRAAYFRGSGFESKSVDADVLD
jgi:hypothetical protein